MNEAVLNLNNLLIYSFGLLTAISFLWGSFVFYKKAQEAHFEDFQILDAIVMSAFWAFIVGRISFVILNLSVFWNHFPRILLLTNYPGIDRWGAILGIGFGVYLSLRRIKAKLFDWLDLVSLGVLSGGTVFIAGLSLLTKNPLILVLALIYLLIYILFWSIEDKYRTFERYRGKRTSARSGLISGFSISFLGIAYCLEKLILKRIIAVELLWGLLLFVLGFVLVYIRSGRTVAEDIKIILKHGRN